MQCAPENNKKSLDFLQHWKNKLVHAKQKLSLVFIIIIYLLVGRNPILLVLLAFVESGCV